MGLNVTLIGCTLMVTGHWLIGLVVAIVGAVLSSGLSLKR